MTARGKLALVVVVLLLGALVVIAGVAYLVVVGKYNALVSLHERAAEGRARFAGAVNTASEKMRAVWTMARQEGILEKETYVEVARARAGFETARGAFENASASPAVSVLDLTAAGADLGRAFLNVRVAFEAYPQLRTSETYQRAMMAAEEGFNEIKTALDDWVALCRAYNTERRSFPSRWLADTFFGPEFPQKIAYYEGGIEEPEKIKVTADELNPEAKKTP